MRGLLVVLLCCSTLTLPTLAANHVQTDSGRVVAFDHKTGNEWWVEVVLGGQDGGQASGVEARDDGGSWMALTWRSWGAWGGSFHIEPGHRVQFRASWAGGAMQDSCWFTHPQGAEQCILPPPTFDATFTLVKGNEWWVQTQVTPNAGHTVGRVDVRLNDGPQWLPLEKQSWGVREYAASYHMPEGTKVQLRAMDTTGEEDLSGCYHWIPPQTGGQDAAEVPCSQPPGFDATFTNVKGNDWWVEARVTANGPLAGVDARVGCTGSWIPLTLRSWGSWAKSFHVVPGSHVDFRARSTGGATEVSDAYVWPEATRTDRCDAPWPRASSYAQVRFRVEDRWQDVDGAHYVLADGLVTTRYDGSRWMGTCEVRRSHQDGTGQWTNATGTSPWDLPPPMGELGFQDGAADVQTVENCALSTTPDVPVVGRETRTFSIRSSSGDPIPIDAFHAESSASTFDENYWWDAHHGLMLNWDLDSIGGSNSRHADGWLLDTDAGWA